MLEKSFVFLIDLVHCYILFKCDKPNRLLKFHKHFSILNVNTANLLEGRLDLD